MTHFLLHAAVFCPLAAFVLSIKFTTVAQVCLILLVLLIARHRRQLLTLPFASDGVSAALARVFPIAFVALVSLHQVSKVFSGQHGVDFVIFSQAIDSISRSGLPTTSLIGLHSVNFLSHHFSPILYPIGALGVLGIPGWLLGIMAHGISLSLALYSIFAISRHLGFDHTQAAIAVTLFCTNPSVRQGLTWSIHDEIFALGFVGLAVLFWLRGQDWWSACMLMLAMTCKETLLAFTALFAAASLLESHTSKTSRLTGPYITTLVTSLTVLAAYSLFKTYAWESTFDPLSRVASFEDLLDLNALSGKLWYMLCILAPTCAYGLRTWRGAMLLLCGAPFWGASLISNFPEMWKPFNYYAVLPSYLCHVGALVTYARYRMHTKAFPVIVLAVLVMLSFALGSDVRPLKEFRKAINDPIATPYSLTFITSGQRVITSECDALFVPREATSLRLWTANRLSTEFDSVLTRKPLAGEPVSARLLQDTTVCYEDSRWILRCRNANREGERTSSNDSGGK